ncbi:hypothetical protein GCM10020331_043070 [Ectobacillus funiculus]
MEFHPIREKFEKAINALFSHSMVYSIIKAQYETALFLVGTLAREMEMENSRHRGAELVDRFMKVLYNLQEHSIIKEWNFVEELDYDKIGTKGWKQYFFFSKKLLSSRQRKLSAKKIKQSYQF